MSRETQKTLFYPYEASSLACPGTGERFLFMGAEPGFQMPVQFAASLQIVQGFRPYYLTLSGAGYTVAPQPEGTGYDGALVLTGRHRGQNHARIAAVMERVVPGGMIVVAGSADEGISSLRKRLERLVEMDGHLPKYHGTAMWFRRPTVVDAAVAGLANDAVLADGRYVAAPGMFSHDRVDAGSRLLAGHLPGQWKGSAADFGAGWGYLSTVLAERTCGLKSIDLYEADFDSLEAARINLSSIPDAPAANFFWHDLVKEKVDRKYDLIVMNPPFHQGRAAEPAIGQAMINTAAASLRSGGRLFMVQNRGLPYDQVLKARFSRVEEIERDGAFRVIVAER